MEITKENRQIKRQRITGEILGFIKSFMAFNAAMPTLAEIGANFNKSKQWASYYICFLEAEKKVKRLPNRKGLKILGNYRFKK